MPLLSRKANSAITAAALVVILVGTGWYFAAGTPQYSLYRLGKAIGDHDLETTQRYLDTDRVADDASDTLFDVYLARQQSESGSFGEALAKGLVELLKPLLKARVRDELRSQLRKLVEEGSQENRVLTVPNTLAGIRNNVRVVREGKVSHVTIFDGDRATAKFRMVQKADRRWQIVAFDKDWLIEHFGSISVAPPQGLIAASKGNLKTSPLRLRVTLWTMQNTQHPYQT